MTATTTLPVLFATGIHSARPAASAVGAGGLYSCTTHSLVYQTDGSSWTTWANLAGTGGSGTVTTVEEVDGSPTDSAVTKLVMPNGTLAIVGHVATYTPAAAASNVGKGCILYHSANQSVGSSSTATLAWDTEETDTDAFHDTVTNNSRITIPTGLGGLYLVNINLLWATRNEDMSVGVQLKKNGSTSLRNGGLQKPSTNSNTDHALTTLVRLAQADYIEAIAVNNTTGAINVIGGQAFSTFEIAYLSA